MQKLSSIDQVWLFGSFARKNTVDESDLDVLVVGEEECVEQIEPWVRERVSFDGLIDIAHYTKKRIISLAGQGSLFIWHLKDEGIPLYEDSAWLKEVFSRMPGYGNHQDDLAVLGQLVEDVAWSVVESSNSLVFDAGVLSTAIRNTAIILTNYIGRTDYSPQSPHTLGLLEPSLKLTIARSHYEKLVECRRATERGILADNIKSDVRMLRSCISQVKRWQTKCMEYLYFRRSRNGYCSSVC